MITHEPLCGAHIKDEIATCIDLASKTGDVVSMNFNGIQLTIVASDMVNRVMLDYARESDRRHREWEASPDGVAYKADAIVRAEKARRETAAAMAIMPTGDNYLNELDGWRKWVIAVAGPSDHVKSGFDHMRVAAALRHAGVKPSQFCGDQYSPDRKMDWVLGQILTMAQSGMPPRPLLADFASNKK